MLLTSIVLALTWTNPILPMDFSDPDVCIGRDGRAYMTASSFGDIPGLPILASDNLVNWSYVGYALLKQPYPEGIGSPEHGKSVYAPSIRYNARKDEYVIYWGDPWHGVYRVAAKDPAGPWSAPRLVIEGTGLIDTCPLYDDDGRIYLVNGWAGSRIGIGNILTLRELDVDETHPISDPVIISCGDIPDENGAPRQDGVCEGPKLYKKDSEYWLWYPAGGVGPGYQVAARSKSIWGPYVAKTVLARGSTPVNGPHQGGVVRMKNDWWFLHFSDRGAQGRITYLEPMVWEKGAWPVVGNNGEPVEGGEMAGVADEQLPCGGLATSDEFNAPRFGLQWFWLGKSKDFCCFPSAYGYLRMFTTPIATGSTFRETPNCMVQRFPGQSFTVTTKLSLAGRRRGDEFGLVCAGGNWARFGFRTDMPKGSTERFYHVTYTEFVNRAGKHDPPTPEKTIDFGKVEGDAANHVYLRMTCRPCGQAKGGKPLDKKLECTFSWSLDGENFTDPTQFWASSGTWIGATVGLYAISDDRPTAKGCMDVDWFRIACIVPYTRNSDGTIPGIAARKIEDLQD